MKLSINKKNLKRILICTGIIFSLFVNCFVSDVSAKEKTVDTDYISKGVVRIVAFKDNQPVQIGSGFAVGKSEEAVRYIVTARHVLDVSAVEEDYDSEDYEDSSSENDGNLSNEIYVLLKNDAISNNGIRYSSMVECECIKTSTAYPDVAILKASEEIKNRNILPLKKVKKGKNLNKLDRVFAFGFPSTADFYSMSDDYSQYSFYCTPEDTTVNEGSVSGIRKMKSNDNNWIIQHTAILDGGDSGGPLVDEKGNVVGINISTIGNSTKNNNALFINYAIEMLDNEGIEYTVAEVREAKESKKSGLGSEAKKKYWIYGGITLVICILIAIPIIIVVKRKRKNDEDEVISNLEKFPEGNYNFYYNNEEDFPEFQDIAIPMVNYYQTHEKISNYEIEDKNRHSQSEKADNNTSPFIFVDISGTFDFKHINLKKSFEIGTNPELNDLVFPKGTPGVSRKHCKIRTSGNKIYIKDQNSSYGTFVDGKKIKAGEYVEIFEGSEIWIGGKKQKFKIEKSNMNK